MIQEGIDSLESEDAQVAARGALATLATLGVFERQKEINVRALLEGPITEAEFEIAERILALRYTNQQLSELAELGNGFIQKD